MNYSFIRCHQSHLINKKFIKSWVKTDGGYLLLEDRSQLPVSKNKKEQVKIFLNKEWFCICIISLQQHFFLSFYARLINPRHQAASTQTLHRYLFQPSVYFQDTPVMACAAVLFFLFLLYRMRSKPTALYLYQHP